MWDWILPVAPGRRWRLLSAEAAHGCGELTLKWTQENFYKTAFNSITDFPSWNQKVNQTEKKVDKKKKAFIHECLICLY